MKTLREMASLTGLSYDYIRKLCLEGRIVHIKTGKKYLVNYDRFIDFLNTGE
ncbi:helix-turn-helix domain-containing protein [Lachnospiraceae bacterium Oil+RF-744-WCA-WT-13]|uniref:Helix-turn-helix domain-containing protein n=2 Tax=Bilifractor porci TaxID=2606636 RepID=A0A7X2P932_9FIRM|nr:helix-turn-helix domain-containing protein [Bilifractor porci]